MGLGKTLTMISLILKDSEKEEIEEEVSTTDDDSLDDSRINSTHIIILRYLLNYCNTIIAY